jgi:hypothetical protein
MEEGKMRKTGLWLLVLLVALSVVVMPGCKKKKSDVRIIEVWGKGSYIGPGIHGDSKLEFRVQVENLGDAGAVVKEFVLEIKAGNDVVIQASKSGGAAFQSEIVPSTAGAYSIAANADFTFSLLYFDHTQDIYNGKNPGTIEATLTIEDDNGDTYDIGGSAAFEWLRY